jgi:hypothetical protein
MSPANFSKLTEGEPASATNPYNDFRDNAELPSLDDPKWAAALEYANSLSGEDHSDALAYYEYLRGLVGHEPYPLNTPYAGVKQSIRERLKRILCIYYSRWHEGPPQ